MVGYDLLHRSLWVASHETHRNQPAKAASTSPQCKLPRRQPAASVSIMPCQQLVHFGGPSSARDTHQFTKPCCVTARSSHTQQGCPGHDTAPSGEMRHHHVWEDEPQATKIDPSCDYTKLSPVLRSASAMSMRSARKVRELCTPVPPSTKRMPWLQPSPRSACTKEARCLLVVCCSC